MKPPTSGTVAEAVTPDGIKLRVNSEISDTLPSAEDLNSFSKKPDELEMLSKNSKAGRTEIKDTANEGLTEKSQASTKRLKDELGKNSVKEIKGQLVTLNVARTELMARLDELAKNPMLYSKAKDMAETAKNALRDHRTQEDLARAI